jgi:phage virion morphogenesis protein
MCSECQMLEVTFDSARLVRALSDLQAAVGDLSPALRDIVEELQESTKQRFGSKIGPDGQRWADNSDVTIERKGRNDPLVGGGTLARELSYDVDQNTLTFGSLMEYAAMQQFGGKKAEFPNLWGDIPARPFIGISSDDESAILAIIAKHLNNAI